MLSRVAERMFWIGRYMERVESTALLLRVNTNLALDLPNSKHVWASLIEITGGKESFHKTYQLENEQNVVKFLTQGETSSIRNALKFARENARTSREIMPREAWEKINKLYYFVENNLDKPLKREGRDAFLGEVIGRCHEFTGYLMGCMSVTEAYNFMRLGRKLERADMTTRILDIGCYNLNDPAHTELADYERLLWTSLLMSLSGYQMYRQHVDDDVNGEDVADFLLRDEHFPRSVDFCLDEVSECCGQLPHSKEPQRATRLAQRRIKTSNVIELFVSGELHSFIDEVQLDLAKIHQKIGTTWFTYNDDTVA
jgi:uncharacterized alpha-E superfamily protein